jgi:hypothetical protein
MASAADRRRAQRRLAKEIKTRSYKPSSVGRRAREVAKEVRERQIPGGGGGGQRDTSALREQVKQRKRDYWYSVKWRERSSERQVDGSSEFDLMDEFLEMSESQADETVAEYARRIRAEGDDYDGPDWSFLFYH